MVTAGSCAKRVAGQHVMTSLWPILILLCSHCRWDNARPQLWFDLHGNGVQLVVGSELSLCESQHSHLFLRW